MERSGRFINTWIWEAVTGRTVSRSILRQTGKRGELSSPIAASTSRSHGKEHRMTTETQRLIEVAFPLKQASIDSLHEKNVRHGHISTLHIWPARRPLAACRAALIATLLPDPGTPE